MPNMRRILRQILITLGDEFQGLLFAEKGADPIFVADRIIDEMFPVRIKLQSVSAELQHRSEGKRRLGRTESVLPCAARNEFAQESRKPRQSVFKNTA